MVTIIMLAEIFLLSLSLGVGFFSFLANTKETGAGFLKVVMGICGASALFALCFHLTYGSLLDPQSILYMVALLFFLLTYFLHGEGKSPLMWAFYGLHNFALIYLLFLFNNGSMQDFFFSLTSILLLGSVTYAMVMGHWYLVTPKLSEEPLKKAIYFMVLFLVIKMSWTVHGYFEHADLFVSGTREAGGYSFNWLMLTMRIGWGYLVLGIMGYFAYRLVAMRSIQSATGMLYAMTFFVFVGELISNYMFVHYGIQL